MANYDSNEPIQPRHENRNCAVGRHGSNTQGDNLNVAEPGCGLACTEIIGVTSVPVCLRESVAAHEMFSSAKGLSDGDLRASAANCIHIGLINNMPDGALEATERQFLALFDAVADGVVVRLSFFALREVPRNDAGQRRIDRFYSGVDQLWDNCLDGLIVTGAEPRASKLTDEAYWQSMRRVLEWSEHNTGSAIWSCLAAHAAVLHLDGIDRRRLSDKRFGVFDCLRNGDHYLLDGAPSTLRVPHSRWNDIAEADLVACGYRVLTRTKDGSVDTFVKQKKALFVFFQGHLEYEANSLLLEYRRDIRRYLRHERETFPAMPQGYFDTRIAGALASLREQAMSKRSEEVLKQFPTALIEKTMSHPWRPTAVRVYRNWVKHLSALKERRLNVRPRRRDVGQDTALVAGRRFAAAE
jgi:homoserine O-succinyltransferase